MIDSLLERNKRFINLDKLIYKDDNNIEQVTTDPNHIKLFTNDHFQNVAGSQHKGKEFSPEWQHWRNEYKPKSSIDGSIYNELMTPPDLSEWHSVIRLLPNNKATGPSKISNEMMKHIGSTAMRVLWMIACYCITHGEFPSQ
jgi:hypothetical protein